MSGQQILVATTVLAAGQPDRIPATVTAPRPDQVFVRGLVVRAILGIHPHERVTPQPVRISFALETDTRRAAASDAIEDALDYFRAAERVSALTRNGQFQLAETLAERIAELLLAEFPCDLVRVEVEKPEALADAASVGVAIERRRDSHPP